MPRGLGKNSAYARPGTLCSAVIPGVLVAPQACRRVFVHRRAPDASEMGYAGRLLRTGVVPVSRGGIERDSLRGAVGGCGFQRIGKGRVLAAPIACRRLLGDVVRHDLIELRNHVGARVGALVDPDAAATFGHASRRLNVQRELGIPIPRGSWGAVDGDVGDRWHRHAVVVEERRRPGILECAIGEDRDRDRLTGPVDPLRPARLDLVDVCDLLRAVPLPGRASPVAGYARPGLERGVVIQAENAIDQLRP